MAFTNLPSLSTSKTHQQNQGAVTFLKGMVGGVFQTLAAANADADVCAVSGIIIHVETEDKYYYRSDDASSWIQFATSGSSSLAFQTTISGLRDLTSSTLITTLLYYTTDEGKEGFWYWDAASTLTDNTGTIIKCTTITTGRFLRVIEGSKVFAEWFGAVGDDSTNNNTAMQRWLDFCFGSAASPNGTSLSYLNKEAHIGAGVFLITTPLTITKLHGGIIRGAGRFTTTIKNNSGGNIFTTNGFEYSEFTDMCLLSTNLTTCVLFDLNWDNTSGAALQSNEFRNLYFQGGVVGLRIGQLGFMGSETLIENCFFSACATAGVYLLNANALQTTIVGGNFQACGVGVLVSFGQVNIYGTGFQVNTTWDIQVSNAANDIMTIDGCRTESINFVSLDSQIKCNVINCTQLVATAGVFAYCNGRPVTIDGCISYNGKVTVVGQTVVKNSSFGQTEWMTTPSGAEYLYFENVTVGTPNSGVITGSGANQTNTNTLIGRGNLALLGDANDFLSYIINNSTSIFGGGDGGLLYFGAAFTASSGNPSRGGFLEVRSGVNKILSWRNHNGIQYWVISVNGNVPDATGAVTIANNVTGSGTANTVAKFTGTNAIGNSAVTDDGSTWTETIKAIFSVNGASAAPAIRVNGTWITGQGTTNNKPQVLIEPTGATSTPWSDNGTGLGINSASGFTGNLIDIKRNGITYFKIQGSTGVPYVTANSGEIPYIEFKPFAWASTGYIEFGATIGSDAAGDYVGFVAPTGKGFFFASPFSTRLFVIEAGTGDVGIGIDAPEAQLHLLATTEQLRVGYDASNYLSVTVGSTGEVTLNAIGAGSAFVFSDNVGLGVTPLFKLHVETSVASDIAGYFSNTAATGNNYGIDARATGSATNNYGLSTFASGATNNYALWLASTAGANNYNIYTGGDAKSYFSGQVGFGSTAPNASAKVQVDSTTQGLLPPRMTKAQRDAIGSPANGLMVFVTDAGGYLSVYNSGWEKVTTTADP